MINKRGLELLYFFTSFFTRVCCSEELEEVSRPQWVPPWIPEGALQFPDDYRKEDAPSFSKQGNAVTVSVFVNIRAVSTVDMPNEKIMLDIDFYEFWKDERFNESSIQIKNYTHGEIIGNLWLQKLDPVTVSKIWMPDLMFERSVPRQDITSQPIVSINNDLEFAKFLRLEITNRCPMSFHYYPLDTQHCEIVIRSYKYPSRFLELNWAEHGVFLEKSRNPNFDIKVSGVKKTVITITPSKIPKLKGSTGNHSDDDIPAEDFDVLSFTISFRRNLSYTLAQTYLPSSFFIVITWLCFFMPQTMAASKTQITMTTLLTINTMFNSAKEHAPQGSYVKAIDIWMVACIFFAFLALLEFSLISWLEVSKEREERRQKELKDEERKKYIGEIQTLISLSRDISRKTSRIEDFDQFLKSTHEIKLMSPTKFGRVLIIRRFFQKHGFWMLSTGFFLFNVTYWTWLCIASEHFQWTVDPRFNE